MITSAGSKSIIFSGALIILLGFAVYGNSLNGQFIWDDEALIEENIYIRNFSNIPKLFTQDISMGTGREEGGSYRPLQIMTYMFDYSLWKLNVRGHHLTNILLHIASALTIFWLISILSQNQFLSLLTGILFVVHPVHTEAVSYISGRADSMVLLFMLLSFIFYLKQSPAGNINLYFLMLLCYALALLSRENSLILPALLLLYHCSFKEKVKGKEFVAILSLTGIYIALRMAVLKIMLTSSIEPTTFLQRVPGFFVALANYIKLLFFPFGLHMEYGNKLYHWGDPGAILGAIMTALLLIYALKKKEDNRLVFFAVIWFFVSLLPVSNLYPLNAFMAEHWLYLPSIGFFLIISNVLLSIHEQKKFKHFSKILLIGLVVYYSFLTIQQNAYWRDPKSFYERTIKYSPDNARAYFNLGIIYDSMNKREDAVAVYKKAVELKKDYAKAYNNLGVAYDTLNKKEEAIVAYKKAIEIRSDYATAYNNLGNVYSVTGKEEESVALYKEAIAIKADYADAYYNLGVIYNTMNKNSEAVAALKKALELGYKASPQLLKMLESYRN